MNKNFPTWLVICFMALTLFGCGQAPSRPNTAAKQSVDSPKVDSPKVESTQNAERSPVALPGITNIFDRERHADDELMIYAKRFGELSAENQKKEYAMVMQALNRNKKDTFNRLKAALIYSLPNSRLRDNTRALPLLADLQRDKLAEDDVSALVSILKDYVEDRQKLEDSNNKLAQKIKDEQRRADELQQKLDALKNIDKTMIERGQGTQK